MAKKKSSEEDCNEILADLKRKIYKPVYLLVGDESYFIDKISDYISDNVLTESEKAFNQVVLYGKDSEVGNIIDAARRYPMSSNHQVVIVKEAQHLKKIEDLEHYLKAPQQTTILVVCYKGKPGEKMAKPTKGLKSLFTLADRVGVFFESTAFYENQVPEWIIRYLAVKEISIAIKPATLLTDFLGTDLSKIVNELEKLIITLPPNTKTITAEHIEKNIGLSKDFNRFELTKALGERDATKAFLIVDHFAKNPSNNPFVVTISAVFQYFIKLFKLHILKNISEAELAKELGVHPFFLKEYRKAAQFYTTTRCFQIISLLREYDLRAKGVNNDSTDQGELLRELVFKILYS
ncbi:MAG TPA: DNA polymerase III subunit delta [Tenuifilaceae bacterium]|jgi:DNA polymerase-3 subunit delta|nr:DNA polymerase III subunit delta [Tenuifilaceae bacterium]HPX04695.1 DNA polymerase III subunit delta [Tenuifilaceae bacterium]HQB78952.1 DNA polymerase III subunit delta [Tenuifilaceae bacterium]